MKTRDVEVLVTGGTGLIGRWLLAALTARGRTVAAVVRGADARAAELASFVDAHGGDASRLCVVEGDVETAGLGLADGFEHVRDVFHLAARFAFGLDPAAACACNVDGALHAAAWSHARPALRRFVFLGGYRILRKGGVLGAGAAPSDAARTKLYRDHGAYEASKHESYAAVRAYAAAHGLAWTAVHPSGVIGDSRTGETTQRVGLGETVERLWQGRLPALVGTAQTFLPLVTVDYLAAFLATVPERDATVGQDLCVLDPATPPLPALVRAIAAHLRVPPPRATLPVALVRALPAALTGLSPESLSFLADERYDTSAADAHAAAVGLARPALDASVARWCDFLVATRFGADPHAARGALRDGTYTVGEPATADVVFLHGLPWNSDVWIPVTDLARGAQARVDLPGLGRSAPAPDEVAWLDRVLAGRTRPVVLVGHSRGCATALRYAHAHPGRVAGLVLISPAFLQRPAPPAMRLAPLVAAVLRRQTPAALAARTLPELAHPLEPHAAVLSACADLARRGVAARTARVLATASRRDVRASLRRMLGEVTPPVLLVHGSNDPLVESPGALPVHVVQGAGHNPQLTRPAEVAARIDAFRAGLDQARTASRAPAGITPSPPLHT